MPWTRTDRNTWRLAADGFSGTASITETNSGVIASITVENTEFDMELVDEREFFEGRDAAADFLQERMEMHAH